jgi:demethylmenaquinone methyltransferase/2-methoxy-6-polyprenyl-1,4-benzoquinol methylase
MKKRKEFALSRKQQDALAKKEFPNKEPMEDVPLNDDQKDNMVKSKKDESTLQEDKAPAQKNPEKDFPLKDYYSKIFEKYDLVNRVFTFGQDVKWRKKAVEECLQNNPAAFLDICTGTGDLVIDIARSAGREIELHGYDFSAEMLQQAKAKAGGSGSGKAAGKAAGKTAGKTAGKAASKAVANPAGKGTGKAAAITFTEGDVASMPYADNTFDTAGITFGIRNLVYANSNADLHLSEIRRVLRPYGRLVILESSKPDNRIWRFFNNLYLQLILPWIGGIISGNFKAYRYLAKSSKNYYSKKEMSAILEKAGFLTVRSKSLFLGSVMLLVAEKQVTS